MRCHLSAVSASNITRMSAEVRVDMYMCMHGSAVRDAAGAFGRAFVALCLHTHGSVPS